MDEPTAAGARIVSRFPLLRHSVGFQYRSNSIFCRQGWMTQQPGAGLRPRAVAERVS